MSTATPLTPAQAVEARDISIKAETALHSAVDTRPVVRVDLGMVIIYDQTATHALESRSDGRGKFLHRINREKWDTADAIPANFRKLRATAQRFEAATALILEALATRYTADLMATASNEYRAESDRAFALDRLAQPNPYAPATPEPACAAPGDNHSDDMIEVHTGRPEPVVMCGYHVMRGAAVATPSYVHEYTYVIEDDARRQRREFIESGREVSLIAFDPSRGRYCFDVLS